MHTISISKEEYLSAMQLHQTLTMKQLRTYSALVLGSFIFGCILWVYYPNAIAGGLVGGSIGGVIGYWVLRLFIVPWKARQIYVQQRSLQEPIEISWCSDGLSAQSKTGSSKTPWNHYTKWRENEIVITLYHADNLFQIVPKKIFETLEHEKNFKDYLSKLKKG